MSEQLNPCKTARDMLEELGYDRALKQARRSANLFKRMGDSKTEKHYNDAYSMLEHFHHTGLWPDHANWSDPEGPW